MAKPSTIVLPMLAIVLALAAAVALWPGSRDGKGSIDSGTVDTAPPVPAVESEPPQLRLLVPAYFYPDGQGLDEWERLLKCASRAPITVVLNPSTGPGDAPDPLYRAIIQRAASQGVVPIGYVNTAYAKRPSAEVQADVDKWVRFYPEIRGVFFDAQASGPEGMEHYAQLRKFVAGKIPHEVVITNPGLICSEDYFTRPVTDAACVFEAPEGFDHFRLPLWADRYPPDRFAVLPYRIGDAQAMREAIARAIKYRIGWVYVTDASGDNPWGRLPRYWEAEVEAVHRVNQRQAP